MVQVFEKAELQLLASVDKLSRFELKLKCLHLKLADYMDVRYGNCSDEVIIKAKTYFEDKFTYIFCCTDGDVFIFSSKASISLSERFFDDIADVFGVKNRDDLGSCEDLSSYAEKIKEITQVKLEKLEAEANCAMIAEEYSNDDIDMVDYETIPSVAIGRQRDQRDEKVILIIDDDEFSRRLVASTMRDNVRVEYASNAEEGLAKYAELAPDVLLLDIGLPDMDGYEVMNRVNEMDEDAYIVMITGSSKAEDVLYTVMHGAKGYISKPFSKATLMQHMHKSPIGSCLPRQLSSMEQLLASYTTNESANNHSH